MGTESDPVIIAQRLLNLYRQLHIFSPEKKEAYNQMLMEQPQGVKKILSSLPGGVVLQQYLAELEGDDTDDFDKPVDNKEEKHIEQTVRPSSFDAQPTVVSVANDPQMIKGIVDAFKEAIITSEKHRKEDTKELAQTIVALQSKVMQDMMNKMSNQTTANASRVETKVTTVETKVMNAEATSNQSGFQLSQLEDVVAGISKAQGELIKDMAQSQTEQLSQLISKVLKEIQQMSTQTLIDAVQAVHRENMDFFKNQIFSSVSKVPMNAEIIEPEVKSEQVKKTSQKIEKDKQELPNTKQNPELEDAESDKKAKDEELIVEKNNTEDTKNEKLEVSKNIEDKNKKEQALEVEKKLSEDKPQEEKQLENTEPEKIEVTDELSEAIQPKEVQVKDVLPENAKKEIDNAETKIEVSSLDKEETSKAILHEPKAKTKTPEEVKVAPEKVKIETPEEVKAENTVVQEKGNIAHDITHEVAEDNSNKKQKKFTFPWEILGKKVEEIKKAHDFVTKKDLDHTVTTNINPIRDNTDASQALQNKSLHDNIYAQNNIEEAVSYTKDTVPYVDDNEIYTPVDLPSLTEEDMVDLDSFSDKEFMSEEETINQSEEEYEWDYVEDNSEDETITENIAQEEDYTSQLEADHIQTVEEEYEWDYVEDESEENEFTENIAQEKDKNYQLEAEHIQTIEDEYEWDYVEEDTNEHILEDNSEEISEEEYEWDYVEEDTLDNTKNSDENELSEEYEWDYVEDTEVEEIDNIEQNKDYVETISNEKKKEKDPYNPRQQNEIHSEVSNPLLAENSFVFSKVEEDGGKIILDDNFGLSSSEESPK